jgi:hypothetical protein
MNILTRSLGLRLLACLAAAAPTLTQQHQPLAPQDLEELPGERLPRSALGEGTIESLQAMLERAQAAPLSDARMPKARNGRQGRWIVPSRRATHQTHSGEHHAINEWGDTRMGIGFPGRAHVRGVWIAGQASPGAWADGLRALGFRDGRLVAQTEWFESLSATPTYWEIDLDEVDRIEIEARAVLDGGGWYALDDLSYALVSAPDSQPQLVTVHFDDLEWRTTLTGSGYAGLDWEAGSGSFEEVPRAIPAPVVPDGREEPNDPGPGPTPSPGPGTLPEVTNEYFGMRMFEAGTSYIPPDTCGAAGPGHFVSVVNVKLGVFDKVSGNRLYDIPLETFFAVTGMGDPRVTYDHHAGRYFLLVASGTRIYLAISLTDDPTGAWFKSYIETAIGSDVGRWPDYPTLGFDQHGYYIAALMVPSPMTIWAIDKAPLLTATPSMGTVTAWRDLPWEGAIQPCVTYGDSGGELLVSRRTGNSLRIRQISGPLTGPSLATVALVSVPINGNPPWAPALGSTTDLGTGDTRPMNAVYRDGSVFTAHTIGVDSRAACRWYELDVSTGSATQVGTIADPVRSYYYPSIAVNTEHHVVLAFSGSHAAEYAGAYYTGHHALDPPGATAAPALLRPGSGPYNHVDGNGINRWGDYSLTSVDPIDDTTFWTIQEYARVNNRWGTWIAEVAFLAPCPSTWNTCVTSLSSVSDGATLSTSGSTSLAANDLTLRTADAVPSQFGLFFYGPTETGQFFGHGILCVTGGVTRLPVLITDALGAAEQDLDVTLPLHAGQITAGSTWFFQFWYRDPAGPGGTGFNLSDGLNVTFCP